MSKSLPISAALLGAMLVASPALAQTDERAPFEGVYVGGSFGGAGQPNDIGSSIRFDRDRNDSFGDTVTTGTINGPNAFSPGFCNGTARASTPAAGCRNDKDGIEYAARVGFDVQRSAFVFGVVGEFGKAEINDSVSAFSTTPAFYTMTRSLRYNAGIRARAGLVAGPSTLFYATGGGAYGRIRNTFTTNNVANSFSTNGSKNAYGYSVGGGVEQKLGRNFSIGLEYLYTDLKDNKARVGVGSTGTTPAANPFLLAGAGGTDFRRSDENFHWHSARVTAAFRF